MIVVSNKDVFVDLGNGKVLIKHKNSVSIVGANLGDIGIKIGTVVINWTLQNGQALVYITERGPSPAIVTYS